MTVCKRGMSGPVLPVERIDYTVLYFLVSNIVFSKLFWKAAEISTEKQTKTRPFVQQLAARESPSNHQVAPLQFQHPHHPHCPPHLMGVPSTNTVYTDVSVV